MGLLRRSLRYMHNPRDLGDALAKRTIMLELAVRNLCSSAAVVSPGSPVVSLTTYGRRLDTVHFTIESIGRGQLRPSRLILWIDEVSAFQNLPPALHRLARRGLEIRFCRNYGPHKKYYPYVENECSFHDPLVTADDDILYPRRWLNQLFRAFKEQPRVVNCNYARKLQLNADGIARFADWEICNTTEPSFSHHAIGMSGVIYPPAFLADLKRAGTGFIDCCPRADDIWLHLQAIRAGYKIRQLSTRPSRFHGIPGTEGSSLWKGNSQGGNDEQAQRAYAAEDILVLEREKSAA